MHQLTQKVTLMILTIKIKRQLYTIALIPSLPQLEISLLLGIVLVALTYIPGKYRNYSPCL